jgi:hypothetical protein
VRDKNQIISLYTIYTHVSTIIIRCGRSKSLSAAQPQAVPAKRNLEWQTANSGAYPFKEGEKTFPKGSLAWYEVSRGLEQIDMRKLKNAQTSWKAFRNFGEKKESE